MADASTAHAASVVAELYHGHHHWLSGWLRRRLADVEQAADLAQDTFVRVLLSRDVGAIQEPRAFLTTVARRVLANHYRRAEIERAWLETLAGLPEPVAPPPETRLMILETLCELDRLLDGLPAAVRRTFLLSQLDGLGYAEIGARLGISVSTVKRHMSRAAMQCYFAELPQ
ncbi:MULTISPECIES: sigma-70 family RNA polymerase sigma factor [Microvirgula]|uniref:sigma-70 family RNA polymerase sigma factor n=1 Tax=Microvirgula TaxID=57479 RepID=UPI00048D6C60|nr:MULTISPECIES: sigma-70 family RNA polymerase sigma factor [Microvirgula]RAS19096.1 RNA polymerase sigma-70 factor (ECF subfamily) [Microvirgula sp. AG722]